MDKNWLRFVMLGIVIIVVVIAWDIFLTISGAKETKEYSVLDISPDLFANVEKHLRDDVKFVDFEEQANIERQNSSTTTSAGN